MPTPSHAINKGPETARTQASREGVQLERVPVLIFERPEPMARQVARRIANLIEERRAAGRTLVLGLPTGSTPIGVYQHLIAMHREQGLDFSNVVTFNLDEYYPVEPGSLQSYHRFMRENFFDHVNVPEDQIHIPRGDIPAEQVSEYCLRYEHAIEKAGGLDLVLLGIGRSGHIGFNEPGSGPETRTRLIVLDEITRKDAASDFFGEENVPRQALTMGVGTILDAREIILMATGEHKAPIIKRAVEEAPSRRVTATYLQGHRNTTFYVDRAAASALTRIETPWLVRSVDWDDHLAKRAVIWLSHKLDKAILTLEQADFFRNQLHELVHAYGNADRLCQIVYEDLRQRITYPRDLIKGQRVIVFSPHPDDDVISMGGMLDKLVANDNEVLVTYMTNGSVAVFDADVRRVLRFVTMSTDVLGLDEEAEADLHERKRSIEAFLAQKKPGQVDPPEVQSIKAHIRYAEAVAGIEVMGLDEDDARFLDMPFYRTGRVRKAPIGEADVQIVLDLLQEVAPDHIFVAGDLSDPHGTHRMCFQAIKAAMERYRSGEGGGTEASTPAEGEADGEGNGDDVADPKAAANGRRGEQAAPKVWLYRGAWQEWEIHRADVFLPLSKGDMDRKIEAIFKHESQKDRAMFPGAYDTREFWERARDRNRDTAVQLNHLGLPEFYAAEAYVLTDDMASVE